MVSVVEYTDPTCFWAWGAEPKVRRLQWRYGAQLQWRRVLGDLFQPDWHRLEWGIDLPDSYVNPDVIREHTAFYAGIAAVHGMPNPAGMDRVAADSMLMCRAVRAAELQGPEVAGRLLRRLREDWFVFGRPSDSRERLLASARSAAIDGLDVDRLAADLDSPEVEAASRADFEEVRTPNAAALAVTDERMGYGRPVPQRGRVRYGFATLIFAGPGGEHTVPGFRPWETYEEALLAAAGPQAEALLAAAVPDPTPAEALERFGLLCGPEFELLCGPGWEPPAGAVPVSTGGGTVWLSAAAAATRTG